MLAWLGNNAQWLNDRNYSYQISQWLWDLVIKNFLSCCIKDLKCPTGKHVEIIEYDTQYLIHFLQWLVVFEQLEVEEESIQKKIKSSYGLFPGTDSIKERVDDGQESEGSDLVA